MIEVTYGDSLLILLMISLGTIFLLWLRFTMRVAKEKPEPESTLFDCDNCHFAFVEKEPVNLTRCPRCNAICIRRKRRHTVNRV